MKQIEAEEQKRKEVKELSVNPPSHRYLTYALNLIIKYSLVILGGEGGGMTMFCPTYWLKIILILN